MSVWTALAASWAVGAVGQAEPPTLVLAEPFQASFVVDQPNRLALSPILDGKLMRHEWDPLGLAGNQVPAGFQWQPGTVFLGGFVPAGKDVVWSLDLKGDGWLVGDDNLQVRISLVNGQPRLSTTRLDASGREGPVWSTADLIEAGALVAGGPVDESAVKPDALTWAGTPNSSGESVIASSLSSGTAATPWLYEARVLPIGLGLVQEGKSVGVRADLVPSQDPNPPAFLPRPTSLVSFRTERNKGLPMGLDWEPTYRARQVMPGREVSARLAFRNESDQTLSRIALWTDGLASADTTLMESPFPAFNARKRAEVTYGSMIAPSASLGWRVLRALVTTESGAQFQLESSYEIAPLVSLNLILPSGLERATESRIIRGRIEVKSNSPNRVEGIVSISVPPSWSVVRGSERKFSIYRGFATVGLSLELIAPQRASGLVPITVSAKMGDQTSDHTVYLPIKE